MLHRWRELTCRLMRRGRVGVLTKTLDALLNRGRLTLIHLGRQVTGSAFSSRNGLPKVAW